MSHEQSNDTQGRIEAKPDYASPFLQDQNGERFAVLVGRTFDDARRIAACWNAFDGIPTDYIEYAARTNNFVGAVQWLNAELDAAKAELKKVNEIRRHQREQLGKLHSKVDRLEAELKNTQESRDHYQSCYHKASNTIRDCDNAEQLKIIAVNAELLAALEHVLNVIPGGGFAQIHHGSDTYAQILAAVDKAKGGAA